jgi:sugar-specific transcriptional regulator TrmB
LELELAGVNEIAKKAGINRSSAYVILESLKTKGLAGTSDDKKVRQYVAASPEMLHRVASDMAKKQEDIRNSINNILPELKALNKDAKHKPKVTVFEGKEGLIAAFESTLNCREKIMRVASSVENLLNILPPDYFPTYLKRRIQKKVKMYGIHPDGHFLRRILKLDPDNFDESVGIPSERFTIPADLAIFDDKIGLMSPKDGGVAIIIENQEAADVMKNIFDLAFEEAKRLNKEIPKS